MEIRYWDPDGVTVKDGLPVFPTAAGIPPAELPPAVEFRVQAGMVEYQRLSSLCEVVLFWK